MTDDLADLDAKPDGAATLNEAHAILTRYVAFPSPQAADAMTLVAAATHAMPHLEFASRALIKSPVKRCGKTRLLDVLAQLVARPLITTDISAAALVRSIPVDQPPTLLLDEADATFGRPLKGDDKAESLRGIINSGFGRDRPYRRWDAASRKMDTCPTFAMAILAGIGDMPDTIEDRAVIITLRRKAPGEIVAKYRIRRDKGKVTAVGDRLAAWVVPNAEVIAAAEPDMPPGLNDRAEDVWEALLAVADLAGGDWPARARAAAQVLAGEAEAAAAHDEGIRLLADLLTVFGDDEKLPTETILAALTKLPESPWDDRDGHSLNPREMSDLLKQFSVAPRYVKVDGRSRRGYRREDLRDPWSRYLGSAGGQETLPAVTAVTAQVSPQMAAVTVPRPCRDPQDQVTAVTAPENQVQPPDLQSHGGHGGHGTPTPVGPPETPAEDSPGRDAGPVADLGDDWEDTSEWDARWAGEPPPE
jgi:hypothetical protein